ncbi:hypothetical protein DFH06DRAFT_1125569 [Mycena polygramma]|nr:hypothetical protein DFH06DRAFT_1125569 [Mycena polygramma]
MVEATDDSFIFAKSLRAAQVFCLHMERFQFPYGWLTQWSKMFAYILNDNDPVLPAQISFPSITNEPGVDPLTMKSYQVPVIRTGLDFLNAKVDDPERLDTSLRLTGRLPITLLHKMVAQNVVSRCRALLSLQPIKQADAEALDVRISMKIHAILGMPFSPNSKILTLPVSHHGLGFPSIARINAGIIVDGILRDLNHHITAYRTMARITLAEWTCNINECIYPLDGIGLRKTFTHYYKKIPAAWITAHGVMSSMRDPISLRMTDQHEILTGHLSISHVVSLCNRHAVEFMRASWLFDGPQDLLASRLDRHHWAEDSEKIRHLVQSCALNPSQAAGGAQVWGTDGSMVPASATLSESRHLWFSGTSEQSPSYSRLRGMNGRSHYRWILDLLQEGAVHMAYTRGHSAELTLPAQLNKEADHYASGLQKFIDMVPIAPTPMFLMDMYTPYTAGDGWIESNIPSFVDYFQAETAASDLALGNRLTQVHDTVPPPDYPYTRALSAHSAVIQLYTQSGQLPMAETLEARSKLDSGMCRMGCDAVESVHYIFVDCVQFAEWQADAAVELVARTERKLVEAGITGDEDQSWILLAAKSLFVDDPTIWPLKISQYYLGQVPKAQVVEPPVLGVAYQRNSLGGQDFREHSADNGSARSLDGMIISAVAFPLALGSHWVYGAKVFQ